MVRTDTSQQSAGQGNTASASVPSAGEKTSQSGELRRTLTLPLLVFYGVGVTVGAGIFALIGEILAVSGDRAPLAFLVAGVIAGFTGVSYMLLVREFPRAGGEAIYVSNGLGPDFGRMAGLGVAVTGTISSAVVALAFGGYVGSLTPLPPKVAALGVVVLLVIIACLGIRESVVIAAVVTLIEVGTLVVVAIFGLPKLVDAPVASTVFSGGDLGYTSPILAGAVVAFFAFIGFEDIANMAEETVNPRRTAPLAIAWTLGISIVIYVLLATIAVILPNRAAIAASDAPMATLFEEVSGRDSDLVATVASLAMTNGILVQLVMAARVIYGMAKEQLLPRRLLPLAKVHASRRTPIRATLTVGVVVAVLVVLVPLGRLARITSLFTLMVFALVNTSLYLLGRRDTAQLHRWRFVGMVGAALAVALAGWEVATMFGLV